MNRCTGWGSVGFRGAWLTFTLGCIVLLPGCAERGRPLVVDQAQQREPVQIVRGGGRSARSGEASRRGIYVVARGDTLYRIAWRFGMTVEALARQNALQPPYTIYPGQRLRTNPGQEPVADPSPGSPRPETGPAPVSAGPGTAISPGAVPPPGAVRWRWPVRVPPVREFGKGNKGLDFELPSGTAVQAAAAGVVVYSGVGLGGYESLVILRHASGYLSAYSLNCAIHRKEGDLLQAGDPIADINGSGRAARFHFEIRQDGDPVGPRTLLKYRGAVVRASSRDPDGNGLSADVRVP